ncbi:MAG: SDR family NAD(P)-dependent oxidoreductase [Myxococcota bacterium]
MKRLEGKVAVVTGAAHGIGRATAELLAREGCRVAICDVNVEGLHETRRRIQETGRTVTAHEVDVSDKARMASFARDVAGEHGAVHIVVNNAGVSVSANFADMPIEDFEWIVGVNFWGVVYGCKFFLPYLLEAGEGHIVNLSSVFGFIGLATQSAYAATKFAVRGFSESLRTELQGKGIGVTSVHPGPVKTGIVKQARFTHPRADELRRQTIEWFDGNGVEPEHAARRIVQGIRANAPRVLITPHAYGIDWSMRLAPGIAGRVAALMAKRQGIV